MVGNEEKARIYHTAVSNYDVATIEKMVHHDYIQHNLRVPTGRAAFVEFLPQLQKHGTKIDYVRIFQDDDFVVMHHLWRNAMPFGAKEKVAFHIIRFDQAGLIAEHWCVMSDLFAKNSSGRTQIDGPATVDDFDRIEQNKKRVGDLFSLLIAKPAKDFERVVENFFLPGFHQHHPDAGDGIEGFSQAVRAGKLDIKYGCLHKVLGAGNFVLAISEGFLKSKPTAFYDLFRLANNLIVEHWSIYQEIPITGLANNNTMFAFQRS